MPRHLRCELEIARRVRNDAVVTATTNLIQLADHRGPGESATLLTWREDFDWHKRQYQQSRFRWTRRDVLALASRKTQGRATFRTFDDLDRLRTICGFFACDIERRLASIAEPIRALEGAGLTPEQVAYDLMLDDGFLIWWIRDEAAHHDDITDWLLDGLYQRDNPYINAWEQLQMYGLYSATRYALLHTMATLAWDLSESIHITDPQRRVLDRAFIHLSVAGVERQPPAKPQIPKQAWQFGPWHHWPHSEPVHLKGKPKPARRLLPFGEVGT